MRCSTIMATVAAPSCKSISDLNLTLFDLYIAVARNVVDRYIKGEFLPTEHALLDDNGDGRGTELQIDFRSESDAVRSVHRRGAQRGRPLYQRRVFADRACAARR